MPATHRIEIHKSLQGEEWTNVYLMQCADMDEAATFAGLLSTFERNIHWNNIRFDYALCSTILEDDRIFRHVALNVYGNKTLGTTDYLPLYNTIRVDFSTADSDPCRKYYRAPVGEADQVNGLLVAGTVTNINETIATYFFLTTLGDNLYSAKGNVVVAGSCHPVVQMRQLHRRKRPVAA